MARIIAASGALLWPALSVAQTPTRTPTSTPVPPSLTPTSTPSVSCAVPPTLTPVPPTPTRTVVPPDDYMPPIFSTFTPGPSPTATFPPGTPVRDAVYLKPGQLEFTDCTLPPAVGMHDNSVKLDRVYCTGAHPRIEGHYCFGREFLSTEPITLAPDLIATATLSGDAWAAEASCQLRTLGDQPGGMGATSYIEIDTATFDKSDLVGQQSPDVTCAGACEARAAACCVYWRIDVIGTGSGDDRALGIEGVGLNYWRATSG